MAVLVLRMSDELKSCGVTDGCTIQVTSRMRGGGRHKDKKSQVEKKQVTRQEPVRNEGPAILESEKEAVIWVWEETEEYRKIVEHVSGGSDVDVERKMRHWASKLQERPGGDILECGLRWAVEARRKERGEEQKERRQEQEEQRRQAKQGQNARQEQSKQGKQVRFREEGQVGETRAGTTGEAEVTGGLAETRAGRGSAGLVRGGDERCWADGSSRKGKRKDKGEKGEHGCKGGAESKGTQQVENLAMDEDQENVRAMKSKEEEESHKEDVRKLVEMMQKEEAEQEQQGGKRFQQSVKMFKVVLELVGFEIDERERKTEAEGKKKQEQEGEGEK